MARLIDADALAENLGFAQNCKDCKIGKNCTYETFSVYGICTALADAPTIMPKPRWISVKDRLPEEHERILTYDKYSDVKENRLLMSKPCVSWSQGFHVTHWMPLPEPPKT